MATNDFTVSGQGNYSSSKMVAKHCNIRYLKDRSGSEAKIDVYHNNMKDV